MSEFHRGGTENDPELLQQAMEVFAKVYDMPAEARREAIARRCQGRPDLQREVESLLQQHDQPRLLKEEHLEQAIGISASDEPDSSMLPADDRIDGYRLIRIIGEGGMGTVYEAEQHSPCRTVALKVIREGLASREMVRRFRMEAHVLGQLHHSGIAQIYSSGVTDGGRPFFAMEYIDGRPLHQYVREEQCTQRERLELLARIADAVHYAHQKGVIHRDLKPENILVDEHGQPKILDFGVARVTDADLRVTTLQTDAGRLIGTLTYMSPEQLSGRPEQIDARADVYAIGVILYELLTGELPFELHDRPLPEAARIIQEGEPKRLSTIGTRYRSDLQTIVFKAMEKEKDRRYGGAGELAADIRRFLNDEPILARPTSTWYQFRKFALRNRTLVGGIAAVFLALVAGTITSTMLYLRSEAALLRTQKAEAAATTEAATATGVTEFLFDLFAAASPGEARGRDITIREMLDLGAERISEELEEQPEVRARLMFLMGHLYHELGAYDSAEPLLREALAIRRELHEEDHPEVIESLRVLALQELRQGRIDAALDSATRAVRLAERIDSLEPVERGRLHMMKMNVLNAVGDYEAALVHARATVEILDEAELAPSLEEHAELKIIGLHMQAILQSNLGRIEEAAAQYPDIIELIEKHDGRDHPRMAIALNTYGYLLQRMYRFVEAEPFLRESVELAVAIFGERSPRIAPNLANLGITLTELGRYQEAERYLRLSLEINRERLGENHPAVLEDLSALTRLLEHRDDAQAVELQQQTVEMLRIERGLDHPETLAAEARLTYLQGRFGASDDSLEKLRKYAADAGAQFGSDDPFTLECKRLLADLLRRMNHAEEAIELYETTIAHRSQYVELINPDLLNQRRRLAGLYLRTGRIERAKQLVHEIAERCQEAFKPSNLHRLKAERDLAMLKMELGQPDEAVIMLENVLERMEQAGVDQFLQQPVRERLAGRR